MSPDWSLDFVFFTDCYLWEKLLRVSQKCFHAAHEKHREVCVDLSFPDSSCYLCSHYLLTTCFLIRPCPHDYVFMC